MEGLIQGLVLAMVLFPAVAWGSLVYARCARWGQHVRPEGPARHRGKEGIPTMGGVVPLAALAAGLGLLALWNRAFPWTWRFILASTGAGAAVGLLDDLRSQRRGTSVGFFPHQTLLVQCILGGLLCLLAAGGEPPLRVPFSSLSIPMTAVPTWAWVVLLIVAFVSTVNAVNLADGLDGLASGCWILALWGFAPLWMGFSELSALTLAAIGAGMGFLWANAHPARVILGNVGSMGLGGFLFGLAWASGGVFVLPLVGGVFVAEALSVLVQVASYKLRRKRVFKMSPLHHHLEEGEVSWPYDLPSPRWPEPQVVVRLWLGAAGCALLGALAILGP